MTEIATAPFAGSSNFEIGSIEITKLAGQPVTVYSKQFPGVPMSSQVLAVTPEYLHLKSGGPSDHLSNLVNAQSVIIQLPYKGEWISITATLKKKESGSCYFMLDGPVVPLSQRKFLRVDRICKVQLAAVALRSHTRRPLNRLCWVKTKTENFSSGGVLVEVPGFIDPSLSLLMNIKIDQRDFPPLVLGQVRYCYQRSDHSHRAGVEFLVSEVARKEFSIGTLNVLPGAVLEYTAKKRQKLNRLLQTGTA